MDTHLDDVRILIGRGRVAAFRMDVIPHHSRIGIEMPVQSERVIIQFTAGRRQNRRISQVHVGIAKCDFPGAPAAVFQAEIVCRFNARPHPILVGTRFAGQEVRSLDIKRIVIIRSGANRIDIGQNIFAHEIEWTVIQAQFGADQIGGFRVE